MHAHNLTHYFRQYIPMGVQTGHLRSGTSAKHGRRRRFFKVRHFKKVTDETACIH